LRKQSEFLEIAVALIFDVKRPSRYRFSRYPYSRLNPPLKIGSHKMLVKLKHDLELTAASHVKETLISRA